MVEIKKTKFWNSIYTQLALVILFSIIFIESIIWVGSHNSKTIELQGIRVELEKELIQKNININELEIKTLDKEDIDDRLNKFSLNILLLVVVIISFCILGILSVFHFMAGRHIKRIIQLNTLNISDISALRYEHYDIPNNEIGEIIQSRKILLTTLENLNKTVSRTSKMAAVGELSATMAHEINNPLSVIAGNSILMKKYLGSNKLSIEKFTSFAEINNNMVKRISAIINSLKISSRDDVFNEEFTKISIRSIIEDILPLSMLKLNESLIDFKFDIDSEFANIPISAQRLKLSQVFINLMNNSIDAIADLDNKWIKLDISRIKNSLILEWRDSGNGIAEELRGNIFKPFFTTKDINEGTGLGMSISLDIVKSHGGELFIKDDIHTCFAIKLPLIS